MVARHVYHASLRWSDQDPYRHINNVMFLRYLEEARVDMLFSGNHPADLGRAEGLVVTRHEIDYRRVLDFRPEPVRVETWVSEVRPAWFDVDYEVLDLADDGARTVYATARSRIVPVNLAEGHPMRITARQRSVLAGFTDP